MSNNAENSEIVYLFVHEFVWYDLDKEDEFGGHLKEGRLYKAEKIIHEDQLMYKIDLFPNKKSKGLVIKTLKGEADKWKCDLEIVDASNVLELPISDEDLSIMAEEKSHKIDEAIPQGEEAIEIIAENSATYLKRLAEIDDELFKLMASIIKAITLAMETEDYIALTDTLRMRPGFEGRLAAATLLTSSIEAHLNSTNPRNPQHLFDIVFSALMEMKRTLNYE